MTAGAQHLLRAGDHTFELGGRPLLMGILNATPDSFSDAGVYPDLEARAARGRELAEAGADLVEVGGESGVTNRPAIEPVEEIDRVVPLVQRLVEEVGVAVAVDTYKPEVADAAVRAGASMVNDPSGLINPDVASVCARGGSALVVTHTRVRPKERLHRPRYDDIVGEVKRFLAEKLEQAQALGVDGERLVICPGPDMGKDPAQTVELLRRLDELHELGRPLLLAVSRKDFVGALLSRAPRERLAGTLAAVAHGVEKGAHLLRLHDVSEARDFLRVRAALAGAFDVPRDLVLSEELRREPAQLEETAR